MVDRRIAGVVLVVLLVGGIYQRFVAVHDVDWASMGPATAFATNEVGDCRWRDPSSLLVLRTPKAGSTSLENSLKRVATSTRRFSFEPLAEWPMGVGPIPGTPWPRRDRTARQRRAFRANLERLVAPDGVRTAYVGHVFFVEVPDVAIVGLAREPRQRLASGYYYSWRTTTRTLGQCALNSTCARAADLGRLCSLHTLYWCGFDDECSLDSTSRVATDAAVDKALHNLNASKLLLVVPAERLDDAGWALLARLLPTYFQGAGPALLPPDTQPYDKRGRRRSPPGHFAKDPASGRWRVGDNAAEAAAVDDLCRQDMRVVDFARRLFESRVRSCTNNRPVH